MTKGSTYRPFNFTPGVQPITDKTAFSTNHWTSSKGIRFVDGMPQKIGGYQSIDIFRNVKMLGVARSIFSMEYNNRDEALIGTSSNLYALVGNQITDITPFQTTPISAANSLSTQYGALTNNPISTTAGSNLVRIADTLSLIHI